MFKCGKLYQLGPLSFRYDLTSSLYLAPVLHWQLQFAAGCVCITLVVSRELR